MSDMSQVITPKSDQINADSLVAGPMTIRIAGVDIRPGTEQPVSIHYDGEEGQPWKPCKSMSRVLVAAWGPDAKAYVGRSVTLYRDPTVKWGGMEVGGIRISHLSDIEREMVMALTATKGSRKPYSVKPLVGGGAVALTLDQARADVEAAETLDDLKAVWQRKSMAPFREQLQSTLDARKGALSQEGPSDSDRGESHTGAADDLIARIEAADDAGLTALEADYQSHRVEMFDVADQDRIETAVEARKAALS